MAKPVTVVIKRSDGREFYIDNETWLIPNDGLDGWANLTHSVTTEELAEYDGSVLLKKRIKEQTRSIECCLADTRLNESARKAAVSFFNPKYSFEVYLTYQGRTLWCEGEQSGFKCDTGNIYAPVEFTWSILCPMPYLLSTDNFGVDVAYLRGKFGFPYHSVIATSIEGVYARGFVMGVYDFSNTIAIANDGDVDTYPIVHVTASDTVVNPEFLVDNAFVRVVTTLKRDDTLIIDFEQKPPVVQINGVNALNKVDRNSTFSDFVIKTGSNTFTYAADDGETNMSVSLYYWKRYLGI